MEEEGRFEAQAGLARRIDQAESSVAIRMPTGKIGLAAFLHVREVPCVQSVLCTCGSRRPDLSTCLVRERGGSAENVKGY